MTPTMRQSSRSFASWPVRHSLRELGVRRPRADRLAGERAELAETAALAREHEVEDEDDDADQAAAAAEHLAAAEAAKPAALAAIVLDLGRIELGAFAKPHVLSSQLACAAVAASMRFAISSSGTSSTCVAIHHRLPVESRTPAERSP